MFIARRHLLFDLTKRQHAMREMNMTQVVENNNKVTSLDFSTNPFQSSSGIPLEAKIVFVSDMFVDDYVGGAELTTQALIDTSPWLVYKLHSRDVTPELLQQGSDRFWIFGNFAQLNPQLIPSIIANLRYSVLEYDYKFCRIRSPEKHLATLGMPCDCARTDGGMLIGAFYYGSMGMWWMSEAQKERYLTAFPFLAERENVVLSSVFDKMTLKKILDLQASPSPPRKGWVVLGSDSWIKGASDAEEWCRQTGRHADVVWNVSYASLLEKLSQAEGFVYLPRGGDTCPRMVIEAKLLGCQLHINDNVQHRHEPWFDTDDLKSIHDYLLAASTRFWAGIKRMIDYRPTISGYTTTYNCVKQAYPFQQCIQSMLQFCDEVCVVDGGSTDGTLDALLRLMGCSTDTSIDGVDSLQTTKRDLLTTGTPRRATVNGKSIVLKVVARDWSHLRHPVFDGMQKAAAREMCTQEYCWQMDSDEIVHEDDALHISRLCRVLPRDVHVMALPVIEYWGGPNKVRLDVPPWKWRLSRNLPQITHGIPVELRRFDAEGNLYAHEGTDGCDMIDAVSGLRLPVMSFYLDEVENVRCAALRGNNDALRQYEDWFNQVVVGLPSVFHYSWYDLPRKIKLYRNYWQNHWSALWDKDTADTAENNLMFGVPWSQVTDDMINERAEQMHDLLGGWVWHRRWDGKTRTPHIVCARNQPKVMNSFPVKVVG